MGNLSLYEPNEGLLELKRHGACAGGVMGLDGEPLDFFPPKGGGQARQKAVCLNKCEVKSECLAYAMLNAEHFGIWGGTGEKQRATIRRRAQTKARAKKIPLAESVRIEVEAFHLPYQIEGATALPDRQEPSLSRSR